MQAKKRTALSEQVCPPAKKQSNLEAEYLQYEKYVCQKHSETYAHTVWHWSDVSDNHLVGSGYIHTYNDLRQQRLRHKQEQRGRVWSPQEYGLDALALDEQGKTYHGIQAKLWFSRKLTATGLRLGTFCKNLRQRSKDLAPEKLALIEKELPGFICRGQASH